MPQMAPLWWHSLFTFTIIMFWMTQIIMYHYNMKINKLYKKSMTINQFNWKW